MGDAARAFVYDAMDRIEKDARTALAAAADGDTLIIDYEITGVERERERTIAKIEVKNQRDELVAILTHIMQLVT